MIKEIFMAIADMFRSWWCKHDWECIDDCATYEPVMQCKKCGIISQWFNR